MIKLGVLVGHPKNTTIKESPGFWVRSSNFQKCRRLQEWFRFIEMAAPQPSPRRYEYPPDTKFLNHGISCPHHEKVQVTVWPLVALCIHLLLSRLGSSASATMAFLRYIKHIPTSRPLQWLFPLLGMLFPQTFTCLSPSPLSFKLSVRPSWLHI